MINHWEKDYVCYILFIEMLYYFGFFLCFLISSVTCTNLQFSFEFIMYIKSYHRI